MILVDGNGTPIGVDIASASTAEVKLVEKLIDKCVCDDIAGRLLYDKAADSDPLRERLATQQIDLICPHRKNRKREPTQDGRKLKRFRKRYKVERTISWLGNYRRLVVRYEYWNHIFVGFAQLACLFTILKRF